jgi:hypothetical protein
MVFQGFSRFPKDFSTPAERFCHRGPMWHQPTVNDQPRKEKRMNPQVAKSCALALIPSVITLLLVQACGGSSDAVAQAAVASDADPIEGAWESTITIRDCTSGAVVRTFKGMNTFHRGGTLSDTNNAPTATRGPGQGVWKKGAGTYTASFRFYRYNADGSLAGSQKVTRTTTLGTDGNSSSGTISAQIIDTSETVLQTLCGTEASVRIFQ